MSSLQDVLVDELIELFLPLARAARESQVRPRLFAALGWQVDKIGALSDATLKEALSPAADAYDVLSTRPSLATLSDLQEWLAAVAGVAESSRRLSVLLDTTSSRPPTFDHLSADLLAYLTARHIFIAHPTTYAIGELLTLVGSKTNEQITDPTTGALLRTRVSRPTLYVERLGPVLSRPVDTIRAEYLPQGWFLTDIAAIETASRLFPRLTLLLDSLGLRATFGPAITAAAGAIDPAASSVTSHALSISVPTDAEDVESIARAGVIVTLSPKSRGDLGFVFAPFGQLTFEQRFGPWSVTASGTAAVQGFAIGPRGFLLRAGAATQFSANAALRAIPPVAGEPSMVFGPPSGTRVEIESVVVSASVVLSTDATNVDVMLELSKLALIVAGGDGDGFLQRVIPREGLRVEVDAALGWSTRSGFSFRGAAGLEATIRAGVTVADILRIDQVHVGIAAKEESLDAHVGVTITTRLGPVSVAVERFGLRASVTVPESGGNFGVAHLSLAFKPPRGAALAIDAGVVVGGGYLAFDQEKQQYSGAVMLEIAKMLNVTAFGLLSTRMPDGSPGFSLLVLISAQFTPPLQLGFGFTLNGIGGLIGVNRTVAVDTLRAGLKSGSMGRILFPDDPIRNAPQIVSDLQAIFPPAQNRFLFGPMIRLGWGTPTLLTLDLGVILELPAPVRLIILGRMRMLLPDQRAPIVKLQLDVLGVIDFGSGDIAIDAVLYDSRVAVFAITGDMALRANFGSRPMFVLAVGGFHPRFTPPEGFPELARVAISLATGNNPRLRLEAYLALTTNTVQFGAHLDLYVGFAGFSLEGYLGFDTLIQFAPFGLIVDIRAGVAIKFAGISLLAIALELTLSGPSPWRARGKAKFTIIFFTVTASFDLRFGKAESPPLPPPTDVLPLLLAAFADDGNWASPLPAGVHPAVSLRQQATSTSLFVHPSAHVQIRQRIAPLDREISRFGNGEVSGARRFTLAVIGPDGRPLAGANASVEPESDMFAPSQFFAMTDEEKLAAPAFESMPSGIRIGRPRFEAGALSVREPETRYETNSRYGAFPSTSAQAAKIRAGATGAVTAAATAATPAETPSLRRISGALPRSVFERAMATGSAALSPRKTAGPLAYAGSASGVSLRPRSRPDVWRSRLPRPTEPAR